MSKKIITLEEKNEMLSDAIEILKSGNKPMIDAFEAGINIILKMVRSRKKNRKRDYKKIQLRLTKLVDDARRGLIIERSALL
jgi:hypothetical protein